MEGPDRQSSMRFLRSSTGPVSLQVILEVSTIRSHQTGSVGRPCQPSREHVQGNCRHVHAPPPGCAATGAARSSLAVAVDLHGYPLLQEKAQGEWPAATRVAALGSGQSAGFPTRNASGPAVRRPEAPWRGGSRRRAHGPPLTAAPPTDQSAPRRPHSNAAPGDPTPWDPAHDADPRQRASAQGPARHGSRAGRRGPSLRRMPTGCPQRTAIRSPRRNSLTGVRSRRGPRHPPVTASRTRVAKAKSGMMHEDPPWH